LGLRTLDAAEVLDGLSEGEQVLMGGAAPPPGQRVRAVTVPTVLIGASKGTREDAGAALTESMSR
jgi:HlyD family secretion protein